MAGQPWPGDNPRLTIGPEWHEFVRLWAAGRGDAGTVHWPDVGGVGDQAAWVVDAFAALTLIDADMGEADRKLRGR